MTHLDVSKHSKDLSDIEMMKLRNHIGQAYCLAEAVPWCTPEKHFDVHERATSDPTDSSPSTSIVPVITAKFATHETARHGLTQLKDKAREHDIKVFDVHYSRDPVTLAVALEPYAV